KQSCAYEQSLERGPGTHVVAFEKCRMCSLGADKIVASIVGWPDNHIIAGEDFEGAIQNRRREMWTVAIEGDHMLPARSKVSKDRGESCREAGALLRLDLDRVT